MPTIAALTFLMVSSQAPAVPARHIPLGVYWPGETVPKTQPALQNAFVNLERHGVNAVWLTHVTAERGAELTTYASKFGIGVVVCPGALDFHEPSVRARSKAAQRAVLGKTFAAWSGAIDPMAWAVADEPKSTYADALDGQLKLWNDGFVSAGRGIKDWTTAVVEPGELHAFSNLNVTILTSDIYGFFAQGCPSGPSGRASLKWWKTRLQDMLSLHKPFWVMGQAFQDAAGPYDFDKNGNLIVLPGGASQHVMPTPEQMKWQAYSAMALGAKGFFAYAYMAQPKGNPSAKRIKSGSKHPSWKIASVETPTGLPYSLVRQDGTPTPQFDALAEAYKKLWGWEGFIGRTVPNVETTKIVKSVDGILGDDPAGALARGFYDPISKAQFLMVVANADSSDTPTRLVFNKDVKLGQVNTGDIIKVQADHEIALRLTHGDAQIYELLN